MNANNKKRFKIHTIVGTLFLNALFITALIAFSLIYHTTKSREANQLLEQFNQSSATLSKKIVHFDELASRTLELCSNIHNIFKETSQEIQFTKMYARVMSKHPEIYSLYTAQSNDDFFQLINLTTDAAQNHFGASKEMRWLKIKHYQDDDKRLASLTFYNDRFYPLKTEIRPSSYYPTQRNWYINAVSGGIYKSSPYLFISNQINGISYSKKTDNLTMGVDITLGTIEEYLKQHFSKFPEHSHIKAYYFQSNGQLIASNMTLPKPVMLPQLPPLPIDEKIREIIKNLPSLNISNQNDWQPLDFTISGAPFGYAVDLFEMVSTLTGLRFNYTNGLTWNELQNNFDAQKIDILQSVIRLPGNDQPGNRGSTLYEFPFALLTTDPDQSPTRLSSDWENKKVGLLDGWSNMTHLKEKFSNVNFIVHSSLDQLIISLQKQDVDAVLDIEPVLSLKAHQFFLEIFSIRQVTDLPDATFSYLILEKYRDLAPIIDQAVRHIKIYGTGSLQKKWLNTRHSLENLGFIPNRQIMELSKSEDLQDQLLVHKLKKESNYLYVTRLEYNERKEFLAISFPQSIIMKPVNSTLSKLLTGFLIITLMLPPAAFLFGRPITSPIKQLELEAEKVAKRQYKQVRIIDNRIKEIYELSTAIKQMSNALANHEKEQQNFIESLIQLTAGAIDDKSPYTGGHCKRVPQLGLMIAEAAESEQTGYFKDFKFENDEERREFRIAAWLHDCGKITIPEYVVDKGAKLETNYNRIHEIRTRFEVLLRDAQIDALKQQIDQPNKKDAFEQKLQERFEELTEQFQFIARCNIGGEFMSDDDLIKIRKIGAQTWQRFFDATLGLSPLQQSLTTRQEELPVQESLLADKPEYLIPRPVPFELDPKLGIKMNVPELLYNLGEIYNLSIRKGTLTPEERFKINEHMINGIKILDKIPLPKELARVPRYASTHHETLNGTGYPRKLSAEELSLPERMLAVADIFEALTAADRPYKKAKPLSVSLEILYQMAGEQHIDYEVFKLFISGGVYLKYAHEFLKPEQIDDVDVTKFMTPPESLADKVKPKKTIS